MTTKRRYKPKDGCRTVWLKVSHDKYELPVAVADTVVELADILGVSPRAIMSTFSRWNRGVYKWCPYRKVRVEIDDIEGLDHKSKAGCKG